MKDKLKRKADLLIFDLDMYWDTVLNKIQTLHLDSDFDLLSELLKTDGDYLACIRIEMENIMDSHGFTLNNKGVSFDTMLKDLGLTKAKEKYV